MDTNCNPDEIDYIIPGNDDAIRAIRLMSSRMADACIQGRQLMEERLKAEADKEIESEEPTRETVAGETMERATISDGSEGPVVEVIRKKATLPEEGNAIITGEAEGVA